MLSKNPLKFCGKFDVLIGINNGLKALFRDQYDLYV